jgi:hypothetical protein
MKILILIFAVTASAKDPSIEIYKPLEFKSKTVSGELKLSEIPALYNLPLKLGENSLDAKLEMNGSSGPAHPILSCGDYREALKQGWSADTTYQLSMESFFKTTCTILDVLSKAKPMPPTKIALNNLEQMPSRLISDLAESRREGKERNAHTPSLAQYQHKADFKLKSSSARELKFEYKGMTTNVEALAAGDFTGSGKDQLLVFKSDTATEGSFRHYSYFILTLDGPVATGRELKYRE